MTDLKPVDDPELSGTSVAGERPQTVGDDRPSGPAQQRSPLLELVNVSVAYGKTRVVDDVSVAVHAGEWLGVIGPNGAGKSSLLKAIAGILRFDGSIMVGGEEHGRRSTAARRIGYVAQKPTLPPGMTTAEYVLLGRTAHLGWMGSESAADRTLVADVLERLELDPMAGRDITKLSGGEAQRATLARALVQEAEILILDEPTSALDLAHQISVLELIDELRVERNLAVVTALHDLTTASRFADRLMLLANGGSVAAGLAAEVLTGPVLSRHYGTPVSVVEGPDGGVVVLPLRTGGTRSTDERTTTPGDES